MSYDSAITKLFDAEKEPSYQDPSAPSYQEPYDATAPSYQEPYNATAPSYQEPYDATSRTYQDATAPSFQSPPSQGASVVVNHIDEVGEDWGDDYDIPDSEKICRICFDGGPGIISPCRCRGSSAYIHRECLDHWRASSQDPTSYHRCNTCRFHYRVDSAPRVDRMIKARFAFWLSVDLIAFFIVWQAMVFALAALTILIDGQKARNQLFPTSWPQWGIDYCFGMLVFLFILGLVGFVLLLSGGGGGGGGGAGCHFIYCGGCDCDCRGGDCKEECVIILLVLAVIIIICGIFVSIFAAVAFFYQRFAVRMEENYRYEQAVEEQVADLSLVPKEERNSLPKVEQHDLYFVSN